MPVGQSRSRPRTLIDRRHRVVVILGPTSVGKTAFSLTLARAHHGIVISADSRQVYRGLDLGTGKVSRAIRARIPHYLIDIASPRRQYTVSMFVRDAYRVVNQTPLKVPIFLVGGSPFYIQAFLDPQSFSHVPPSHSLRRRLATLSLPVLMSKLQRLEPDRAKHIDPANRRRIIRAIEIASAPRNSTPPKTIKPPMEILRVGLRLPRHRLLDKIDQRVDTRLRQGMLKEVQRLHQSGLSWKRLDSFGLEYRFLTRILRGQVDRQSGIRDLKSAIHDFARRQSGWWRRDQDIRWFRTSASARRYIALWLARRTRV